MNYVGRLFSNFKGFYNEINSATLTGAIDVIIVKQEDGTYLSSPFHVRFGKMGVLHSREKVVDIEINGEPVDLHMKLGEAGEAFFVHEEEGSEYVPEHLATSPIPSAMDLMEAGLVELHRQAQIDDRMMLENVTRAMDTLTLDTHTSSRSITPTLETGVATQTGTPPLSPRMSKEDSENSICSTVLPKKDSQTSLYQSVQTSFDHGSDDDKVKAPSREDVCETTSRGSPSRGSPSRRSPSRGSPSRGSPSRLKKDSGSDDDRKSDMATQTDMTGDEVLATLTKSSPSVSTTQQVSSDESVASLPMAAASLPSVSLPSGSLPKVSFPSGSLPSVQIIDESSPTSSSSITVKRDSSTILSSSSSPTRTKISSAKKKRRKKIEQKRREMQSLKDPAFANVSEAEEADNSSVEGQPGENLMFDLDMSGEDTCDELTMSRTVSMPIIDEQRRQMVGEWASSQHASAFHPFSDGDITPIMSPIGSRPPSPKSDTEFETQQFDAVSQTFLTGDDFESLDVVKWKWGELPESAPRTPKLESDATKDQSKHGEAESSKASGGLFNFMRKTKKVRHQPEQEGIYLDDLNLEEMDPELAALYLYHPKAPPANQMLTIKDEDNESGRGGSLPQSPVSHEHPRAEGTSQESTRVASEDVVRDLAMSLCGGLRDDGDIPSDKFAQFQVTYDQFSENPSLIMNNPNLVVRISDKYYNWQIGGPIIMSCLVFQKTLPGNTIDTLIKQHMPKKDRKRGWIWWRTTDEPVLPEESKKGEETPPSSAPPSVASSPSKSKERKEIDNRQKHDSGVTSDTEEYTKSVDRAAGVCEEALLEASGESLDADSDIHILYKKSLKLTTEQIAKLNLQDGVNDVSFSVTTQYQGTSRCTSSIYLWNWDDRIIISDIDGTITKSDVLGQILPIVGKDWSQQGIASLYNAIHRNGYKFLYLSARAIGQSKITRDYLRSIRQGQISLPDGPLLLSPSSLISAFHREVIERKPEEFKISCLRDIAALFPKNDTPFYSGFGNKINDVWAYRAVGIPMTRIFTVNHKGELKMELTHTFQSSYTRLNDITDHFFPPLVHKDELDGAASGKVHAGNFPASEQFSTFTYWREPLLDIEKEIHDFKSGENPPT